MDHARQQYGSKVRSKQAGQLLGAGTAATAGARAFFRLAAAVPALRRRAFAGEWSAPAAPRAWERIPLPTAA